MAISKWLCKNNSKNMVVKIVHPGGHKELHDRPILAIEVMRRNPKCVVAYPNIFQQPWAIVEADTPLMLGQKFYVVPISTVRKLQRRYLKNSPSPLPNIQNQTASSSLHHNADKKHKGKLFCVSKCFWSLVKANCSGVAKGSSRSFGSDENRGANKKSNNKDLKMESPDKSGASFDDHWQPGLESIKEVYSA